MKMNETKAVETLIEELRLTRSETASLVDGLNANWHTMQALETQTRRLAYVIEAAQRRGFWQRLAGG